MGWKRLSAPEGRGIYAAAWGGRGFFARFFGASMVPVQLGEPQWQAKAFLTAAVWRSS
jgi:hypothetical protein